MAAALYCQLQQSVIRFCDTRRAEIANAIVEHMQYGFVSLQYAGVVRVCVCCTVTIMV